MWPTPHLCSRIFTAQLEQKLMQTRPQSALIGTCAARCSDMVFLLVSSFCCHWWRASVLLPAFTHVCLGSGSSGLCIRRGRDSSSHLWTFVVLLMPCPQHCMSQLQTYIKWWWCNNSCVTKVSTMQAVSERHTAERFSSYTAGLTSVSTNCIGVPGKCSLKLELKMDHSKIV